MPDIMYMYGSNCFSIALRQHHLERLQKLQKRAVRAAFGQPPHASDHPLLAASSLLCSTGTVPQQDALLRVALCQWHCICPFRSAKSQSRHQQPMGLIMPLSHSRAGAACCSSSGAYSSWNALPPALRMMSVYRQ
eukprot:scpid109929/ scgid34969/ 